MALNPDDVKPIASPGVHCCLCLNLDSGLVPAATLLAGYAVCAEHANITEWRLHPDNSLNLPGTVEHMRYRRKWLPKGQAT